METKFNFKSQICTSKVQSERLLALGLKKETADCQWFLGYDEVWQMMPVDYTGVGNENIPAWSLHRLMSLVFNSGGTRVELFEDEIDELLKEMEE